MESQYLDINDFFLNIPDSTDKDTGHLSLIPRAKNSFKLEKCPDFQAMKIIQSVKSKAHGNDLITNDLLSVPFNVTLSIITSIINFSINANIFPKMFDISRGKPIRKSPKVEEIKDLKSISIMPFLSKVLEIIFCS